MNNVVLIGRLTKDPELRCIPNSGTAVCDFTLAVDKQLSKQKKEEMEARNQPTADFIRIVVWNKMAENSAEYLEKGRLVAVSGRIQTGHYEGDDGKRVYTTDVVANNVQFLEWKEKNNQQNNQYQGNQYQGNQYQGNQSNQGNQGDQYQVQGFYPVDNGDVPF